MRVTIKCPIGKEPLTINAVIISSGSANFQLPSFCPTCRASYSAEQLEKMDDDTMYEIAEYERSWQMLDGFEGDEQRSPEAA